MAKALPLEHYRAVYRGHQSRAAGFGITPKCKRYLTPLIQGEDYPKYKDGLPVYVTLKNVAVAKKLAAFKL